MEATLGFTTKSKRNKVPLEAGFRIGAFVVESVIVKQGSSHTQRFYVCRCDCGETKCVTKWEILRRNHCNHRKTKVSQHPLYGTWKNMIYRCENPKATAFCCYGGRGISVCDRWRESLSNFAEDMGERPAGTTLDRLDSNGHYCPENCRWATKKQQARNTRSNVLVCIDGKEAKLVDVVHEDMLSLARSRIWNGLNQKESIALEAFCIKENAVVIDIDGTKKTMSSWCRINGIKVSTAHARIKAGWNPVHAVTVQVGERSAKLDKNKTIHNGQEVLIRDLCRQFGIGYWTLRRRIVTLGIPADKAVLIQDDEHRSGVEPTSKSTLTWSEHEQG